jgi:hypothetical protein
MPELPSFLDFEASSLSNNSYPIEAGWTQPDGRVESHLISPQNVPEWTDWSSASEQVHHISREELITSGKTPSWICERMNRQLNGKTVFSDSVRYDGFWLSRLFAVAGKKAEFTLASSQDLVVKRLSPNMRGRAQALSRLAELEMIARTRVPGEHRAAWDAQYLLELWKLADHEPASS